MLLDWTRHRRLRDGGVGGFHRVLGFVFFTLGSVKLSASDVGSLGSILLRVLGGWSCGLGVSVLKIRGPSAGFGKQALYTIP